jgi:hypothetical protein
MEPQGRGNSFANGNSMNNGPTAPWTWCGGYQAPRPVTHWDFTEGRHELG